MNKPIFRSAITDEEGDVDVGYLALIWGLIGWGISVLFVLVIGAFVAYVEPDDGAATIQAMGIAVGAVSGGFATMLGAVGLFRMGDKARVAPGSSSTTTTRETVVEALQQAASGTKAKPMPVSVVKMPATSAPPERASKGRGKR